MVCWLISQFRWMIKTCYNVTYYLTIQSILVLFCPIGLRVHHLWRGRNWNLCPINVTQHTWHSQFSMVSWNYGKVKISLHNILIYSGMVTVPLTYLAISFLLSALLFGNLIHFFCTSGWLRASVTSLMHAPAVDLPKQCNQLSPTISW